MLEPRCPLPQPHLSARKIVATHRSTAIEEPNVLTVRDRCKDGAVGEATCQRNEGCARQRHLPQDLSCIRIQTESENVRHRVFLFQCRDRHMRRDKQEVAPNGHIAHPRLGHRSPPTNALIPSRTPLRRRLALDLPVAVWTRCLWPVLPGTNGTSPDKEKTQDERWTERLHDRD